jgi:molybdopterin-guanine dinucleotide biosynthesis protein
MPCTVLHIDGPPRSGKTTMALGMLERLHAEKHQVLYVAANNDCASDMRRRTCVPVRSWASLQYVSPGMLVRAIAVDGDAPVNHDESVETLRKHLDVLPGPTQLIVVREV